MDSRLSDEHVRTGVRVKNIIKRLGQILPPDLQKTLQERYEDREHGHDHTLLTENIQNALETFIEETEQHFASLSESGAFEEVGLSSEDVNDRSRMYEKREELRVTENILNLLSLTGEKIASNRISNESSRPSNKTIKAVLDHLKKRFGEKKNKKGEVISPASPFQDTIENIDSLLKAEILFKEEGGKKHRLAILFTDDPRVLWHTGRYPNGGHSCLRYDKKKKKELSKYLMGPVGDPNCKVVYAIDLEKLPEGMEETMQRDGLKDLDVRNLLEASVSRSLVKVVRDADSNPAVLIEPQYGTSDTAAFFDLFVTSKIADRMGVPVLHHDGFEPVFVGDSLSPEGQYEDTERMCRFTRQQAA